MAALEAGSQWQAAQRFVLDGRVKPGHDGGEDDT
jgi:hypothetical protein